MNSAVGWNRRAANALFSEIEWLGRLPSIQTGGGTPDLDVRIYDFGAVPIVPLSRHRQ